MPCYRVLTGDGNVAIVCGNLGRHCAECRGFGDYLCDYPVGRGKTCDRAMCQHHRHEIAPGIDYCAAHFRLWTEFRTTAGIGRAQLASVPVQRTLDL